MKKLVIGVSGTIGSGKDEIVKFLMEFFGFKSIKLSDIVKIFCKNFDRKTLQDTGNFLRKNFGNEILVKIATFFDFEKGLIIDGIRNPGEVKYLKENFKFILIGVDADPKVRFERLLKRGREDDPKSYEEFLKIDKRDKGYNEPKYGQLTNECLRMADIKIINEGSLEDVKKVLLEEISKLL